ncbi:MAG: hypothetical protein H7281_15195 [Bacteriovorax sp.]|nr:hypothetical protein [Bacteriovorax sp.]
MLKKYFKKLKLAFKVFKISDPDSGILTEEDLIRGIVSGSLSKFWNAKNIQNQFQMQNLLDQIVSDIYNKESRFDNFSKSVDHLFQHQMWYFSIVAGYAALWEFKVKLLAEHLNIDIKKPYELRSSKHKNTKIMTFKDLSIIITEIDNKIEKHLNMKLKNLNELRSSLIHGNFDQLRILANNCKHKYKPSHRGNVFVFNLARPDEGANLSDDLPRESRETQSLFSWFMDTTNSGLLKEVWELLDKSISQMNAVIDLGAHSFDGREVYFHNVIYKGEKISKSMMECYDDSLKHHQRWKNHKEYFSRLKELFGPSLFYQDALEYLNIKDSTSKNKDQ